MKHYKVEGSLGSSWVNEEELHSLMNDLSQLHTNPYVESYKGVDLTVRYNDMLGHLCGYVRAPKNTIRELLKRKIYNGWSYAVRDGEYPIHDLLFGGVLNDIGDDEYLTIGFSCEGKHDLTSFLLENALFIPDTKSFKNFDFVIKELRRAVDCVTPSYSI